VDPVVEDLPERKREAHGEAQARVHHPGDEHVFAARARVDRGQQRVAHGQGHAPHGGEDRRPFHGGAGIEVPGQDNEDDVAERDLLPAVVHDIVGTDLPDEPRTCPGKHARGRGHCSIDVLCHGECLPYLVYPVTSCTPRRPFFGWISTIRPSRTPSAYSLPGLATLMPPRLFTPLDSWM